MAVPQLSNGNLRALAVTSPKRNSELPDVPTLAEAGVPGDAGRGICAAGENVVDAA